MLGDENLVQIIEFPTWSRIVNNVLLESTIDHIYVKDPTMVGEVHSIKPLFGDHLLISVTLGLEREASVPTMKRDWRKYSKEVLLGELALIEWITDVNNVQNLWDEFESKLVKVVDKLVPLTAFNNDRTKQKIPNEIRHKINKRKKLLK